MDKYLEFTINADYCRDMADQAKDTGLRIRWLELASRWLKLADQTDLLGSGADRFQVIRGDNTGKQSPQGRS